MEIDVEIPSVARVEGPGEASHARNTCGRAIPPKRRLPVQRAGKCACDFQPVERGSCNLQRTSGALGESDGSEIYNRAGVDGFKVYATHELTRINGLLKESLGDDWPSGLTVSMSCIGDTDYVAVDHSTGGDCLVVDCFMEYPPDAWKPICATLDDFFERLVSANGQKFWLDSNLQR